MLAFPLFLLNLLVAFAQDPADLSAQTNRNTPRQTLTTYYWWLQENPAQWKPELAAQCLDLSHLEDHSQGIELAIHLRRWLDAKGIYVNPKSVPDIADYVDPKSEQTRFWLSDNSEDLKRIYLTKTENLWLFSSETVAAIPELYGEEFPPLVDFVFDNLPKRFRYEIPVLGVKLWQIVGVVLLAFVAWLLGGLTRLIIDHPLRKLVSKTKTNWDDVAFDALSKPLALLVVSGFLASTFHLLLFAKLNRYAEIGFGTLAIISIVWGLYRLAEGVSDQLKKMAELTESQADDHLVPLVRIGLRIVVVSIGILLILQSLGINVGTLVAGLGIGGLAVALAAQNILGDLFASITIAADKPFAIGEDIQVGDQSGKVEYIGLKTTRLRSANGELLIYSNTDLLKNLIRNFKRMHERRVVRAIGITYQTSPVKLESIPRMLEEIVNKHSQARFDRAHLKNFGASSLDFELVYWIKSPDFRVHMDIGHKIGIEILQRFEKEGIEFAYPTQTLILEQAKTG